MTQEESQCIFTLNEKPAEDAVTVTTSTDSTTSTTTTTTTSTLTLTSSSSKSTITTHSDATRSSDQRSTLKCDQELKIEPSQRLDENCTKLLPSKSTREAKRTPSNVSTKSVTFCPKYIYAWYPPAIDIDLVSIFLSFILNINLFIFYSLQE